MKRKVLIISQVFWPDTSSVAQHLSDLAEEIVFKGYEVGVLTSSHAYENKKIFYPNSEYHKGIHIKRLRHTSFGKKSKIGRVIDFLSFNVLIFCKLILLKTRSYDLVIGLTVPPLLSFFGIITSKIKKMKFLYWAMDLQPELSIAAGYFKKNSLISKMLILLGNYIFQHADLIITLDKYMAEHIRQKRTAENNIKIIPVWPVMDEVYEGDKLKNPFRLQYKFGNKKVIMYSGNHSVMHPLDTLLNAALKLKDDSRFLFVFIGGGIREQDVFKFKMNHDLNNIIQLPYQPRNKIHQSLGSADIHAVIQGKGCKGLTHSNKIYGAMYIGCLILYIGPKATHITDILDNCPGNITVEHGQTDLLIKKLYSFADLESDSLDIIGKRNSEYVKKNFIRHKLLNRITSEIELLLCNT